MAVVSSVPFTLSGTVTLPIVGVKTGVSTSYSLITVRATTTTTARVRTTATTTPTTATTTAARTTATPTVESSSALTSSSSSSVVTTSSSSTSSAARTTAKLETLTRTTTSSSSSSTSSSTRTSTSATRTSTSSSASSASASVAAAATSSSSLSPLARSLIIAAACVGGVVILALAIGFVMRRMRRKRRHEDDVLGAEMQDQSGGGGGKGGYGGASDGYGSAATGGGAWGTQDDEAYHEKTLGAGAAGFGSGNFVGALGRNERPVSPALPNHPVGLYAGGYAASDVSLHGQPMGPDGANMYGVDVGGGNGYNNLGHGYPPGSPYYNPQGQAQPGQYFPSQQQQQQPYGNNGYGDYPAVPSTVALASAYPDQSYDNLSPHSYQQHQQPSQQRQQAPPVLAVSPPPPTDARAGLPEDATLMRVVRGFQATLSDELHIQPFTTLALLQTYDDGWCLCEDLETHRQGVVPRDCLAAPELVNGQMETGARALTPTTAAPSSSSTAPAPQQQQQQPQAPAPVVDEKRALAAASAMGYAGGSGSNSQHDEPGPVPYAEEDPHGPARPLPTLPPPSFSESNLFAQAHGGHPQQLAANEYPREKAVATPPPRLDVDFGPAGRSPGSSSTGGASGSRIPRLDTLSSLAPSERQERRSSLMDSVRAAGAYLEGNGSLPAGHAQ